MSAISTDVLSWKIGTCVEISDIKSRPDLNGKRGVVRSFCTTNDRICIDVFNGETITVKPEKLERSQIAEGGHSNFLFRIEARRTGSNYTEPEEYGEEEPIFVGTMEIGSNSRSLDSPGPVTVPGVHFATFNAVIDVPQIEFRVLIQRKSDGFVIPLPNASGSCCPMQRGMPGGALFDLQCPGILIGGDIPPLIDSSVESRLPFSRAISSLRWSTVPGEHDRVLQVPLWPFSPACTDGFTTSLVVDSFKVAMQPCFHHEEGSDCSEEELTPEMSISLWSALSMEGAELFTSVEANARCGCPFSKSDGSCWVTSHFRRCGWTPPRLLCEGNMMMLPGPDNPTLKASSDGKYPLVVF